MPCKWKIREELEKIEMLLLKACSEMSTQLARGRFPSLSIVCLALLAEIWKLMKEDFKDLLETPEREDKPRDASEDVGVPIRKRKLENAQLDSGSNKSEKTKRKKKKRTAIDDIFDALS